MAELLGKKILQLNTKKIHEQQEGLNDKGDSGTFILITFGNASVAQSVLSLGNKGDFFSVNWG